MVNNEWIGKAACYGKGSELFFSDSTFKTINKKMIEQAKNVCRTCSVSADCLAYAINQDERFGIWGGYSSKELSILKKYFSIQTITKEEASVLINKTVLDIKTVFKNTLFVRSNNG
jgi:WhiB family redox-sensing transcriptional regulator